MWSNQVDNIRRATDLFLGIVEESGGQRPLSRFMKGIGWDLMLPGVAMKSLAAATRDDVPSDYSEPV
jgi:hypothetical protein